ncbi:MAG: hypothetical protein Q7J35_11580 [Candidatus Methanoperedens sp.]|nr:hypothetical protein [Candidatus Methanoperedens sp.]
MRKDIINILNMYYRITICFFIAIAFIKLFSLFAEPPNYTDIINYGERGTILIATLAILTFTYALTIDSQKEKEAVREIGKKFLNSFLYFVIGLIFSIGLRDAVTNPSSFSIFPAILVILSMVIMFILFFTGLVMLIISAVYLGTGIYELTKSLSK